MEIFILIIVWFVASAWVTHAYEDSVAKCSGLLEMFFSYILLIICAPCVLIVTALSCVLEWLGVDMDE